MDIQRLNPSPRWSDATIYRNIAHFVEVPADTSTDIQCQVQQVLEQADATLAEIGGHKSRLLSATIYITQLENLAELNRLWETWLPQGTAPSRACLRVGLVDPHMLVEIAFVAAVD